MDAFDGWAKRFGDFVGKKGKVPASAYRAYGYKAPGHLGRDLQLLWRDARMRTGFPPEGSSPAEQQKLGLNQDALLRPGQGEGKRLRD